MAGGKNLYTIPAGIPFAASLAQKLLSDAKDHPETLPAMRILLPTRRACRTLREAFLKQSGGRPLLLPVMQALGDIDADELSLSIGGQGEEFLNLPPAMPPLQRQIILARTILATGEYGHGPDQALRLASALGGLIDQIHTEGLDIAALHHIVPEEFADHWQITLDFLKILSVAWPDILTEYGMTDGAARRDALIRALSAHWRKNPPAHPVIAAGSTGSIPATAELLATIAGLEQGCIVLPGLDQEMDEESWQSLEETHPQSGLKHLLDRLGAARDAVALWPSAAAADQSRCAARRFLATEIMRPSETSRHWTEISNAPEKSQRVKEALTGLEFAECESEAEEAETIAVLLRGVLEEKEKTAALITPDRELARRVTMACQKWGITLDDSAGQTLGQTPCGAFLRLTLETALQNCAPLALISLLKHIYCTFGIENKIYVDSLENLEKIALRGLKPKQGLAGLEERLSGADSASPAHRLFRVIAPVLERFISAFPPDQAHNFAALVRAHITLAETIAAPAVENSHIPYESPLWSGEDGEASSGFFSELLEHAPLMLDMTLRDYAATIEALLQTVTVRPSYGAHPRLMILGQLEARLVDADLLILGGLNEGTWPADPGHDPWMSRPMRKAFGLPPPERHIGLSAHDFVQGFCSPRVVLTRAAKTGHAPGVPSRWLQRLSAVLEAAGIDPATIKNPHSTALARELHREAQIQSCDRPEPKPPLDLRPKQLSVTRIETWMKDPYSIYARYILRLEKLENLEKPVEAKERGTLLHRIFERFLTAHPKSVPDDAVLILESIAGEEIEKLHDDPAVWSFWKPRFSRLARWYAEHETDWREGASPLKGEAKGRYVLGDFTLTAIADRIDRMQGGAAIIDYKSGGSFSQKAIKSGASPQLPLEALILTEGGFEDIPAMPVCYLGYWTMTGGAQEAKITKFSGDTEQIIETAKTGLEKMIRAFANPHMPYYSLPRPSNAPRFNDYVHLARIGEWGAGEDGDSEAEAA